jgi:hypothetical protein
MKHEFDFAALSKNWQQQPLVQAAVPTASDLQHARQRQRQQWYLLAVEWLGAFVMVGTATWLITSMPSLLSNIAAVFLLFGFVMSLYVSWHVHRPLLTYDNWSSHGVVAFRLRSCQLSLWYCRYNQFACAILLLFVVVLWGLWFWQPAQVSAAMLKFYTLIAFPLCWYGIYRLQQHIRQLQQTLRTLRALAVDFEE